MDVAKNPTPLTFKPKPTGRRRSLIEWSDQARQAQVLDWRHRAHEFGLDVDERDHEDPDTDAEPARLLADDDPEAYSAQTIPDSDDFEEDVEQDDEAPSGAG